MEVRVRVLEENQKQNKKDLDKLELRVSGLEENKTDTEILKVKVGRIDNTVQEINNKLEKNADGKNTKYWQILFYLGTTIFGTILGFLINK